MGWDDAFKIITTALFSVGSASVIIFSLSSFLSKVWVGRILAADTAKYSQALQDSRAKYDKEIEDLKTINLSFINSLAATNTSYLESQKVYVQARISAIEKVWAELMNLREKRASSILFLDILDFSNYSEFSTNGKLLFAKKQTELAEINSRLSTEIDKVRPFLDERSYQLFWVYRALEGKLCFYIQSLCLGELPSSDWRVLPEIYSLISTALSEDQLTLFKKDKWTTIELFLFLETLLSDHLRQLASGAQLASETLDTTLKFNKLAAEYKSDTDPQRDLIQ